MSKRVAVSDSLSPVKQMLSHEGYQVVNLENDASLSGKEMDDYDAVIVSGVDNNMVGMQDISGSGVVINAAGKFPEEIVDELKNRFRHK